jgi:hypothetical protein
MLYIRLSKNKKREVEKDALEKAHLPKKEVVGTLETQIKN